MSALLAMIFAASLSSTDIDEFFTLPAWLPDEVSSDDTPGSDPEWYVEEYTNAVKWSDWEVTNSYGEDRSYYKPWWREDLGKWQPTKISDDCPDGYMSQTDDPAAVGDEDSDSISWSQTFYCATNFSMTFTMQYSAHRDFELEPVATGGYTPKAARLSTDVQSGILSTFAAYCERQYFASQGQSNVWDEAVYGPRAGYRRFWFAPDAYSYVVIDTNSVWELEASILPDKVVMGISPSYYAGRGWYTRYIGSHVGDEIGWTAVRTTPSYIPGNKSDTTISGNLTITQRYGELLSTNFTFTAEKHMVVYTNEFVYDGNEYAYVPTNRTVTSRRLLQYDNIKTLAEFILDRNDKHRIAHMASYRPGRHWMNYTGRWPDQNYTRLWWSTTDDSMLADDYIVPSFGWIEDPFSNYSNQWAQSSLTFENIGTDPVWFVSERDVKEDRFTPTYALMSRLDFGQSTEIYDTETYCWPDWIGTMTQQLAQVYTHADPCAITNDTRRLQSDRLCNVNQVLGLMDRTYHVPEVIYPTVATNYNYIHSAYGSGSLYIDGCHQDSGGNIVVEFANNGHAVWDSIEYTIQTNVEEVVDDGKALHYASSGTSTDHMKTTNGTYSAHFYVCEGTDEIVKSMIAVHFTDYDLYTVLLGASTDFRFIGGQLVFTVGAQISTATNTEYSYGLSVAAPIPNSVVSSAFETRQYSCHIPVGDIDLGITQPGYEGFNRSDSYLGRVIGYHLTNRSVATSRWGQMLGNSTNDTYRYRSNTGSYNTRESLLYSANSAKDDLWNIFHVRIPGLDPFKWQDIIPINNFDSDINTIKYANGRVAISGMAMTEVRCWYDPGRDSDFRIESIRSVFSDDTQNVVSNYVGLVGLALTADYSSSCSSNKYNEATPVALDGKTGIITRTDWDWKTLNRSSGN